MSNYKVGDNKYLDNLIYQNERKAEEKYKERNLNSAIIPFELEMKIMGYDFDTINQLKWYLPRERKLIIPKAMSYYSKSISEQDKRFFLSLFHFKGFEECIPMLLADITSDDVSCILKAEICETIRAIHSPKYIEDYLKILGMTYLGDARNSIMVLLSDFKVEEAIPLLIDALEEGKNITTNAITSLGTYRREELRPYFERYLVHKNSYYRRAAKRALMKLE